MRFEYELIERIERIGEETFHLTTLKDLNQTIDLIFYELKRTNEEALLEELCPYFGQVWPSARALCLTLDKMAKAYGKNGFKGVRFLEIGFGLALPSLTLARLGAEVIATDCHPDVPHFLKLNLERNLPFLLHSGASPSFGYEHLDWSDLSLAQQRGLKDFDHVIGSDILYESHHPDKVAQTLVQFLRPGGRITIADPGRPYLQQFVTTMQSLGFKDELIPLSVLDNTNRESHYEGSLKEIYVFKFTT